MTDLSKIESKLDAQANMNEIKIHLRAQEPKIETIGSIQIRLEIQAPNGLWYPASRVNGSIVGMNTRIVRVDNGPTF